MGYNKHLKVERAAKNLGFTNFPLLILYGRPKSFKRRRTDFDKALTYIQEVEDMFFRSYSHSSGIITDTATIILQMLEQQYQFKHGKLKRINEPTEEPCFFYAYGIKKRVHKYYFLIPTANLYIELNNKVRGLAGLSTRKHAFQLKIYSTEETHKYNIANAINSAYSGGILNLVDNWETIERYFNVRSDECIKVWNLLLKSSS